MDDHQALVTSLGESCVDYIGADNLEQLTVSIDTDNAVAHVEICLTDDSWESREHAIDRMIEVRQMFLEELSIDYAFADGAAQIDTEKAPVEYALA